MKRLKIGLVDLDTSHPVKWTPILKSLGHQITGVYDSCNIYPKGYAREFADKNEIICVYESLEEMARQIDVAIIHSCNWEVHLERALPFLKEKKGVFIDKPMVGNMKDAFTLLEWSKKGDRISGGSALRYAVEVEDFHSMPKEDFGEIEYVFSGCGEDEFNYGIHAYTLAHGLLGPGIESVRHIGTKIQHLIELVWKDGKRAVLSIGKADAYIPFYATVVGSKQVRHICIDNTRLYRPMLEKVLPYLGGETEIPPASMDQLLEIEIAAMAAKHSWGNDNKRVYLSGLRLDVEGYDGYSFARRYQLSKLGK